jgi:hypothetical protein
MVAGNTAGTENQYFSELGVAGGCPDYLTTEVCAAILERNLKSNSKIVVMPLQDMFALHYDLRTMDPERSGLMCPASSLR